VGNRASTELPVLALKWILLFIHLLPLLTGRRVIKEYISELNPDSPGVGLAIWRLFTTYIAMGAMEIGLIILFGRH
jgi:hypothetical protein